MAKTLELNFMTETGKVSRLAIDNPKEPIDQAVVKQSMEQIIASNAFHSPNGNYTAVESARVIERNVTDYEIV
ncbi:hypothetical protein AM500_14445 [Bacillus sp. FJAT-18017]|uniref:DUF2922 domain-containing protein n=1 Tax=unclassified Bacillus (in: firmicutes) TaxID=185979 RepID=UPI0005C57AA9|nr:MULTISPECIES: DUF2922 domain-containing protein [unclassified Bacillus (in: firmicutes)]ALC92820.1 hypothetical protein AM500_14445 [Bacillus sp. FJAT-18017]